MSKKSIGQSSPVTKPFKKYGFNPKVYAKNGVTEEQVIGCKQAYDVFDPDRTGSIDIHELKATMTVLELEQLNPAIFQMISDLDAEGKGTIDFKEWLGLMTKRINKNETRQNFQKIFAIYDDEKTGYLSIKNLRRVAKDLRQDFSEEQLLELIDKADSDHDGFVSFQDFYSVLTRKIPYQ